LLGVDGGGGGIDFEIEEPSAWDVAGRISRSKMRIGSRNQEASALTPSLPTNIHRTAQHGTAHRSYDANMIFINTWNECTVAPCEKRISGSSKYYIFLYTV
jgi:hypothetical protein